MNYLRVSIYRWKNGDPQQDFGTRKRLLLPPGQMEELRFADGRLTTRKQSSVYSLGLVQNGDPSSY